MNSERLSPDSPVLSEEAYEKLLGELSNMAEEARKESIALLLRNSAVSVRSRTIQIGAAFLSDDEIVAFLRNDADDVMRNAGLEMLKKRGNRGFTLAVRLLHDDDPDVIIQAILALDNMRDPRALDYLRDILKNTDVNLIQAAIVALGHLGDARVLPDLLPFLAGDLWLKMAAIQAIAEIGTNDGITALKAVANDEMLGSIVRDVLEKMENKS